MAGNTDILEVIGGTVVGTVVGAACGALTGAVSGALGGAVLKATHHGYGYSIAEAAKVTTAGSSVIGAVSGLLGSRGITFFKNLDKSCFAVSSSIAFVGGQTLGGMLGYSFFINTAASTMNLGQIAASAAVGSSFFIPITLGLVVCLYTISVQSPPTVNEIKLAQLDKKIDALTAKIDAAENKSRQELKTVVVDNDDVQKDNIPSVVEQAQNKEPANIGETNEEEYEASSPSL